MRYWSTGRRLVLAGLVAVLGGSAFIVYMLFFWYQEVVVIAPGGVAALEAVRPGQVELRWVPRAAVHPESLRRSEEVVGKYARRPLAEGQAFLATDLLMALPRDTLLVGGLQVPPGHVLAGVKVDLESGLGGLLRPRSLVDLIAVPKDPGPARLFAQKVLVVAVAGEQGQPVEAGAAGPALARPLSPGPGKPAVTVLALTPEQAVDLAGRTASGRIVLVLTSEGAPDLTLPLVQQEGTPVARPSGREEVGGRQP